MFLKLPASMAHRRFGALRLDIAADDDTSFATEDESEHQSGSGTTGSSQGGGTTESRLQRELRKRPYLVATAAASLQFLEALLSTSTADWREATLHHVCKRWRVNRWCCAPVRLARPSCCNSRALARRRCWA